MATAAEFKTLKMTDWDVIDLRDELAKFKKYSAT